MDKKNLEREILKFKDFTQKNKKKLIYISTYSVNDNSRNNKLYVKNKIKIEKIIKRDNDEYIIIRLPEIIGKTKNLNTLTNFFYNNIVKNKRSCKFFILYSYARHCYFTKWIIIPCKN